MGIRGLMPFIKGSQSSPAAGLKEKSCHVDMLSIFYSLINSRAFQTVSKCAARDSRTQARKSTSITEQPSTIQHASFIKRPGSTSSRNPKRMKGSASTKEFAPSLQDDVIKLIEGSEESRIRTFLDEQGRISDNPPEDHTRPEV
jgi:hypothetical protein